MDSAAAASTLNTMNFMNPPFLDPTISLPPGCDVPQPPSQYYENVFGLFPDHPRSHGDGHASHHADMTHVLVDGPDVPLGRKRPARDDNNREPINVLSNINELNLPTHRRRHIEDIQRWLEYIVYIREKRANARKKGVRDGPNSRELAKLQRLEDVAAGRRTRHWWWVKHEGVWFDRARLLKSLKESGK